MLHFCNAGAGTSGKFLAAQLGTSYKAAARMADRIRRHMQAIDANLMVGGNDVRVFVDEIRLRNVIPKVKGRRNSVRVLMLSDGVEFRFLAIPEGRFRDVRREIRRLVRPHSTLCFRDLATYRKIAEYRRSLALPDIDYEIHTDRFDIKFSTLSVLIIRLNMFVVKVHIWTKDASISKYISNFEFVYRRMQSGQSPFLAAIGCFPDIDKMGNAE